MPEKVAPMLATLTGGPFTDPEWYFEPKLDGYRIIALVKRGRAKLQSRNFQDYTDNFPGIATEMGTQPVAEAVFDGELVALDERGKPCFQCLQQHVKQGSGGQESPYAFIYYVFDLIHLNGYNLTGAVQTDRVKILDDVLRAGKSVKRVSRLEGDGDEIFAAAVEAGMEGVIGKRRDAKYYPGKRSADWLKIKATQADEFIIAGYTAGQGSRAGAFGSLVLGQYGEGGRFNYVSNVGTGFNEALLQEMIKSMRQLVVEKSPFDHKLPLESAITWLKPVLVAEVKFAERTRDGGLRAPVFLRLREDKPARDVRSQRYAKPPGKPRK
ncbi:non-homologous end-joining DNA ligase [Dehalogenimonas alkenigignens]|uniref:DNA ligase (ATP) n=1 Tax=Dehalogenimonas alkenigignens TaxID=1217799 RepID=A0A0W0GJP9_9CHLR|nr:non-homologous end-joining DNA ligase [Dehalogenimonas alkenigignens]KTB48760.1 DNA ligase D, ligase domain [Dehalogenimonas alkenigignens]PVV84827.1 hypothetical protein DD509_00495 [Dehalogenimonas alkenigignens]